MELFVEYAAFISIAALVLGLIGYAGWPRPAKTEIAERVAAPSEATGP